MAAVDFLPVAQPAARPDQAVARKPASSPNETGGASFADVLETEVETGFDSEAPAGSPAPADAAAQPSPAPAASPVSTAAAAIAAVLQAPTTLLDGEAPVIDTSAQPTTAATPKAHAAPVINPQAAVGTEASPPPASGAPAPAPAVVTTAPTDAGTSKSNADIPAAQVSAPPSPKTNASVASSEAAAMTAASTAKTNLPMQAVADQAPSDAGADPGGQATPDAAAAIPPKPAHSAPLAPEVVAATPPNVVAVQVVAAVAGGQTTPKQTAPATVTENAPGQRRKTAGEAIAQTPDASSATTKQGAQSAQPGASTTPSASGQAKPLTQAAAATANTATPDVKADTAAGASSGTSTSSASTSFADALAAARGQSPEAGRSQTASPHLQSAPSAAVQVYTRVVERFDGRAQRFEVRLDPAELGRVDVRIEVGADKKVHAILAAHDSAALTDLMRGQRSLERALSDAGIDLADNGLRFELSQDSGRNLAGQQRGDGWPSDELAHAWRGFSTVEAVVEADPADLASATRVYSWRAPRLDLVA